MKLNNLRDLFLDQLRDMYSAETQIIKAMPRIIQKASDPKLKAKFETHLQETHKQVEKLEQAFTLLNEKPTGHHCKAMAGILEEAEELMQHEAPPEVMDAGLIAEGQRIEHYEIAGYGTAAQFADQLNETKVKNLLGSILSQEKRTDEKLTQSAESTVNPKAAQAGAGN